MIAPHVPSSELLLTIASLTDVGMVRQANEDSFVVVDPDDPQVAASSGPLVVVADGMGGAVGGAHASRMVVETLRDAVYSEHSFPPGELLGESIQLANRNINSESIARLELKGMGSTCTAMLLLRDQAHIAHVGDSRAYLVRSGRILPVTDDHTKVQLLLDAGMITPEEAETHPERSVLIRSIGPKPTVEVDVLPAIDLEDGDRLVLCSDGLINHVNDPEILQIAEDHHPDQAVDELVKLAKDRGGSDNITVHVVAVGEIKPRLVAPATVIEQSPPPTVPPRGPSTRKIASFSWFLLILAGLGGIFVGIAVFAWILSTGDDGRVSISGLFGSEQTGQVDTKAPPPPPPTSQPSNEHEQNPGDEPVDNTEVQEGTPEPIDVDDADPAAMTPVETRQVPAQQTTTRPARVPPKHKVLIRSRVDNEAARKRLKKVQWRLVEVDDDVKHTPVGDTNGFVVQVPDGRYRLDCLHEDADDWFETEWSHSLDSQATARCAVDLKGKTCNCR